MIKMGKTKISIGYGSDTRPKGPKNAYGGRSGGKKLTNGGFNNCPTVDFIKIDQEKWDEVFPNSYKPSWLQNE